MILVYRGEELVGSLLRTMVGKRPWYAYAANGPAENFRTRKEAEDWLLARSHPPHRRAAFRREHST